jgi:agmatine deiminase
MKYLIGEFEEQSFTQIIFPHANTDWRDYLQDAQENFVNIINTIIKYQKCLVVCNNIEDVKQHFKPHPNLYFVEYETNDTWARDCSALSIFEDGKIKLYDFTFSAWGDKFEAKKDNLMSKNLSKYYSKELQSVNLILEGGGVESNGIDTILTTSKCMLNSNRNNTMTPLEITQKLQDIFGASKILFLNHGYLSGDDTDSHIDTLARFINKDTIMYVKCEDQNDEHFQELQLMEQELKSLALKNNLKLIPLPMASAVYYKGERLPATYANFLFVNGAILLPVYGVKEDIEALELFKRTFVHLDIIPIECSTLIRQHGSLHCVTMNFAAGVAILL